MKYLSIRFLTWSRNHRASVTEKEFFNLRNPESNSDTLVPVECNSSLGQRVVAIIGRCVADVAAFDGAIAVVMAELTALAVDAIDARISRTGGRAVQERITPILRDTRVVEKAPLVIPAPETAQNHQK